MKKRAITMVALCLSVWFFNTNVNSQTLVGIDYSYVGSGFKGPFKGEMEGILTGNGFHIWGQKTVKNINIELTGYYSSVNIVTDVHNRLEYDEEYSSVDILNFVMQPQVTYGINVNILYYLLDHSLYVKAGMGAASSTHLSYSLQTLVTPYHNTQPSYRENLSIESNRVWGNTFCFGSGFIEPIYQNLFFKFEIEYLFLNIEPTVKYKMTTTRIYSPNETYNGKDKPNIGFINFNIGLGLKLKK